MGQSNANTTNYGKEKLPDMNDVVFSARLVPIVVSLHVGDGERSAELCHFRLLSESEKEKELAFSPRTPDKAFGRKGLANDCIPR